MGIHFIVMHNLKVTFHSVLKYDTCNCHESHKNKLMESTDTSIAPDRL